MSSTETGYVHSVDFNTRTVGNESIKVMNARVFIQRSRYDDQKKDYVDTGSIWVDLSIWGKKAEQLQMILVPGASIMTTGSYYQRKWQHKDTGEDRYGMGFRADEIAILPRSILSIEFKPRASKDSQPDENTGVSE